MIAGAAMSVTTAMIATTIMTSTSENAALRAVDLSADFILFSSEDVVFAADMPTPLATSGVSKKGG